MGWKNPYGKTADDLDSGRAFVCVVTQKLKGLRNQPELRTQPRRKRKIDYTFSLDYGEEKKIDGFSIHNTPLEAMEHKVSQRAAT